MFDVDPTINKSTINNNKSIITIDKKCPIIITIEKKKRKGGE